MILGKKIAQKPISISFWKIDVFKKSQKFWIFFFKLLPVDASKQDQTISQSAKNYHKKIQSH